jgi:mono/diheme cytochrome c family protein
MFTQTFLPIVLVFSLFFMPVIALAEEQKESVIEQGRQFYLMYGCAVCHGKDGLGDGIGGKNMNPAPTNLHKTKEYLHGFTKGDVFYSIKAGVRNGDSIMPSFAHLTYDEIEAISQYVVSLQTK